MTVITTVISVGVKTTWAYDEKRVVEEINRERTEHHLPKYTINAELSFIAQKKVRDMMQKQYWSHQSPSGELVWDLINTSHLKYQAAGENLAKGFTDDYQMVKAWMDSPTHRANILSDQFTVIGLGEQTGNFQGKEMSVVSLVFIKP